MSKDDVDQRVQLLMEIADHVFENSMPYIYSLRSLPSIDDVVRTLHTDNELRDRVIGTNQADLDKMKSEMPDLGPIYISKLLYTSSDLEKSSDLEIEARERTYANDKLIVRMLVSLLCTKMVALYIAMAKAVDNSPMSDAWTVSKEMLQADHAYAQGLLDML